MDKEERRKIRKKVTMASIGLLLAVLAFLTYMIFVKQVSTVVFYGVIVVFLLAYWVLLDIVEPKLLREFDGKTDEQKSAYYKYAGADLLGYAGIAYFIFNIGNGSSGFIGAVVYILCLSMKRKFREQFLGVAKDTQAVSQAEEVSAEEMQSEEISEGESEEALIEEEQNATAQLEYDSNIDTEEANEMDKN